MEFEHKRMAKLLIRISPIVVILTAVLSGCTGDEPGRNTDSKDRVPMLIHWADKIILPAYSNIQQKVTIMRAKADEFAAQPTEASLLGLRQSWAAAYVDWQKVEMFEFGPADKVTLRNFFNIYPANLQGIHQNITDPSVNMELPGTYATQGFPALDYLINAVADTDGGIVAFYSGPEGAPRLQYLETIITRMESLLLTVIEEWNLYRETFVNKTGLDLSSSMGLVVNAYVLNYERYIRSGKFGIPSGALTTTGGAQYPEKVEGVYKRDISLTLAKTAHQASVDFFNGKSFATDEEGPSLKSYLDALEAKDVTSGTLLSQIVNNQFSAVDSKMTQLSENLYEEVNTNNNAMLDAFTEMQRATRILKVDMTSATSITITYTDNDGD